MSNSDNKPRAGLIPYYLDSRGNVFMLFMIPSDSAYGGSKPQIAKGKIDPGETPLQAAIREAHEELGLNPSNTFKIRKLGVETNPYKAGLHLYLAQVKNPTKFDKFSNETAEIHWLTPEDFEFLGRKIHIPYVQKAAKLLTKS